MESIADLRREYQQAGLNEGDVHPDPLVQFERWLAAALASQLPEPNAMTLATATPDGQPSARMVLFKGLLDGGFVFYTNYESQKGLELAENPRAALVFFWPELHRQVRVTGEVERLSEEDSERYFRARPLGSRLSAWASQQSRVVASREVLERQMAQAAAAYPDGDVPLPPYWGGLRVVPGVVEFWQGRLNRFHDRLRYTRQPDSTWRIERLSP